MYKGGHIPLQVTWQVAGNTLTLQRFSIKLTTIVVGNPLNYRLVIKLMSPIL